MNPIEQFVKRYELRSKFTVKNYTVWLNEFFRVIKKDPNTYFDNLDKKRYQNDIEEFYFSIIKLAPKSRGSKLFCLKSFFMRNEIDIPSIFFKDLLEMVGEKGTLTQDNVPTIEELQRILHHAGVRERAWILFAISSGMRIGEIIQLTMDNIKFDEDPVKVFIPASIGGYQRTTFISKEAKQALLEWLKTKPDYLEHVKHINHFVKKSGRDKSNFLFPVTYNTLDQTWNKLLKKTGLYKKDERTGHSKMHIHCLRKFAKTRMLYHIPEVEVNYMIGHSRYLSREYERPELERIATNYKKSEDDLSVFNHPSSIVDTKSIREEIRKELLKAYENKFKEFDMQIKRLTDETHKMAIRYREEDKDEMR